MIKEDNNILLSIILISLSAAFVLVAYEIFRPASASLFMAEFGASNLPWVMSCVIAVIPLVTILYSKLLERFGPKKTYFISLSGASFVFVLLYMLVRLKVPFATAFLYVWVKVYIVIVIEEIWSFVNSTVTGDRARKVNGTVLGIATLGSVTGGFLLGTYAKPLGTENCLLIAVAATLLAAVPGELAFRVGGEPQKSDDGSGRLRLKDHLAVKFLKDHPVIRNLVILVFVTQLVVTVLDVSFHRVVQESYPAKDPRSSFLGYFWSSLNGGALVFQFILTPLFLQLTTLRKVHLSIPLIHMAAAVAFLTHPILATAAVSFYLFKVLDYSLFRAAKEIFYIPLSFDARYRAKAMVDVFFYRMGKGIGAALLAVSGVIIGIIPIRAYPAVVLGLLCIWFFVAHKLTADT